MLTNHPFCVVPQEGLDRCPSCSKVWVCWHCEGADHQLRVWRECSATSKCVLPAACVCICNPHFNGMHIHMLQGGLNALSLAAIGNHEEVVRVLVEEFGLSVTHRDNVSCTLISQLKWRSMYVTHYSLNDSDIYLLFTLDPINSKGTSSLFIQCHTCFVLSSSTHTITTISLLWLIALLSDLCNYNLAHCMHLCPHTLDMSRSIEEWWSWWIYKQKFGN